MTSSEVNYTIVIPHKNAPELLARCLASIPERADIEIIIIDDNSSVDVVDFDHFPGSERKNTQVFYNKKEGGAGHARNIALPLIKGKWTIFADADDFFNTAVLNEATKNYLNNTADVIYFTVDSVLSANPHIQANRGNKLKEFAKVYKSNAEQGEKNFRFGFTEPWGKIIRTSLIKENDLKFDETYVANDYWFAVSVGYHAREVFVDPRPIYIVTYRNDSLTTALPTVEKLKIRIEISAKVFSFFKEHKINYQEKFLPIWMWILFKKNKKSFFLTYFKLVKQSPHFVSTFFSTFNYGATRLFDNTKKRLRQEK